MCPESLSRLDSQMEELCEGFGFPKGAPFQWVPNEELWMNDNLNEEKKSNFFIQLLTITNKFGVKAMVAIEDTKLGTATKTAPDGFADVISLFLERVQKHLSKGQEEGVLIIDEKNGENKRKGKFLINYLELLQSSPTYVKPQRISLNVLSTPARFNRLLQLAKVITSCSVAIVGGEVHLSSPVFSHIKPLFLNEMGRIGGVGLKIHPDIRYSNLYHWLLGDSFLIRVSKNSGIPLPSSKYPYYSSVDL
ncbi:MAG TPA: hypothetical protein VGB26_15690 [Nitrospiria bacterium]